MASISLSPSSVVGGSTGNVIAVTGSGTNFTGTPFIIPNGGFGGLITAQSVSSATSGSITVNAGLYNPNSAGPTIQDTSSGDGNPFTTLTVTKPASGAINWGWIGDSLYAGNGGNGADYYANIYLTGVNASTITLTNRGLNGTSTQDWAPGGSYLAAAVTAIKAAGATLVHIMLGTNDARTPNSFSAATHNANLRAIVNYCVANGLPVILHKMPSTQPNAGSGGAQWPNDPNGLYCQYWALDEQIANGVNVFTGDSGNYNYSYDNIIGYTSDGVHPFTTYWQTMISMQCIAAMTPLGYPLQGGRIIGGGVGLIEPVAGLGALAGLLRWNPLVRRRFWAAQ